MRTRAIDTPVRSQFMGKVEPLANGCWRWLGSHMPHGYASATWNRKTITAHRLAYMLFVGPIADGLDADHLCFNRWCVNPNHVEPVTHRENIRRMPGWFGQLARATHCQKGHEYTEGNTIHEAGRRRCRICRNASKRSSWHRRAA